MNADHRRIDREAAAWLARHEAGLSAPEAQAFAHWRAADPRHNLAYRAIESSWHHLDRLRTSEVAPQLEAELDELPARGALRSASGTGGRRHFRLSPWVSGALAAGFVGMVVYFSGWRPLPDNSPYAVTAATDIGGARTMKLPDGSVIRLNTGTALEVQFTATERRVRLDHGEAFFEVAKNRARPFIVSGAGVDVRAVGTEFNVRLHARSVEVIVREGAVRVDDAAAGQTLLAPNAPALPAVDQGPPLLRAGQRLEVFVGPAPVASPVVATPVALAPAEISRSLAWQERRLVFDSTPLSVIVAEFNRYNRRPLVVDEAELAARHFGGSFKANDPATFIALLQTSYDVVTEERADGTVLRLRR